MRHCKSNNDCVRSINVLTVLKLLYFVTSIVILAWFFVSWIDVAKHNCYPGGEADMMRYNLINILLATGLK